MKKKTMYACMLLLAAFSACKKNNKGTADRALYAGTIFVPDGGTLPLIVAAGDVLDLPANGTYSLNGKCYVSSGATIRIHEGVTIRGVRKASADDASALVICRGGFIDARGTACKPITFTGAVGDETPGAWGGISILGRSLVNQTEPYTEGIRLNTVPAGIDVHYGGTVANDSSGVLQFVKILYPGTSIADDNDLNGLNLCGVGSRTVMEHVYVGYSGNDGFAFFGGAVHAKWLIARSSYDDQFSFTHGYTGNIQFALSYLNFTGVSYNWDANAIESENLNPGASNLPKTHPHIANMTIIGGNNSKVTNTLFASRWWRNTEGTMQNSVMMGYDPAMNTTGAGALNIGNNLIHSFSAVPSLPASNRIYTTGNANDSIKLIRPFGTTCGTQLNQLDLRPHSTITNSPAATGAVWNWNPSPFFQQVTYRGAFDPAGTPRQWTAFICPCQ